MRRRAASLPRRGSALLATLATIALLASVTAITSSRARERAGVTRNAEALLVSRAMAESGVLAARTAIEAALQAAGDAAVNRRAVFDAATTHRPAQPWLEDTLGTGAFAVVIDNISARFDINAADDEGLTRLLQTIVPADEAARIAARIGARVRGDLSADGVRQPFATLDEVDAFVAQAFGAATAQRLGTIATMLTVDGDGHIDRLAASAAVRAAASGSLVDEPTRVLIVSRGARIGHPAAREIQAVYAIEANELRLVTWRERDR